MYGKRQTISQSTSKKWLRNSTRYLYSFCFRVALACWSFHYLKRIYETLFVHRFSHGTMPIMNLFKNCGYYWGFALYVAYHTNHPLYTPPSFIMQAVGLSIFTVSFPYLIEFRIKLSKVELTSVLSRGHHMPCCSFYLTHNFSLIGNY